MWQSSKRTIYEHHKWNFYVCLLQCCMNLHSDDKTPVPLYSLARRQDILRPICDVTAWLLMPLSPWPPHTRSRPPTHLCLCATTLQTNDHCFLGQVAKLPLHALILLSVQAGFSRAGEGMDKRRTYDNIIIRPLSLKRQSHYGIQTKWMSSTQGLLQYVRHSLGESTNERKKIFVTRLQSKSVYSLHFSLVLGFTSVLFKVLSFNAQLVLFPLCIFPGPSVYFYSQPAPPG